MVELTAGRVHDNRNVRYIGNGLSSYNSFVRISICLIFCIIFSVLFANNNEDLVFNGVCFCPNLANSDCCALSAIGIASSVRAK